MVAVGKCHEEFVKAFPELKYSGGSKTPKEPKRKE
jgi:hypothetical protein